MAFNIAFMTTRVTWFSDTSVNHHMKPDIMSIKSSKLYFGNDQLDVRDDKGLVISYIAHFKIITLKHTFILSNILHVSHIKKPLLYVQKFCLENNVFLYLYFIILCFMLRT